jgi:hypothetical protein
MAISLDMQLRSFMPLCFLSGTRPDAKIWRRHEPLYSGCSALPGVTSIVRPPATVSHLGVPRATAQWCPHPTRPRSAPVVGRVGQ